MVSDGWRGGCDDDALNDDAMMHDDCSQEKVMRLCLFAMYRSMTHEFSKERRSGMYLNVRDKMVASKKEYCPGFRQSSSS